MSYENFSVNIENHIAHVAFNRPEKANALDQKAWEEMKAIFERMDEEPAVRVVVLSGEGKHFCAGIDLSLLMSVGQFGGSTCEGRRREDLRKFILKLQDCITSIERCSKPVMAAIHKGCIGGAVDIITACDMRYCTDDAYMVVKEIDLGLVADIGTMQRLPKILQPGMTEELVYTGRKVFGAEAKEIGLVNRCYTDKAEMMKKVGELAASIASKSPLCIRGTKKILKYTREHSIQDSLDYMATWNSAMLLSDDLMEAFQANMSKQKPNFKD